MGELIDVIRTTDNAHQIVISSSWSSNITCTGLVPVLSKKLDLLAHRQRPLGSFPGARRFLRRARQFQHPCVKINSKTKCDRPESSREIFRQCRAGYIAQWLHARIPHHPTRSPLEYSAPLSTNSSRLPQRYRLILIVSALSTLTPGGVSFALPTNVHHGQNPSHKTCRASRPEASKA